ncbi:MAG: phage integrase SAM-like domain-containing protein [Lentimicrobiaceae bacterium]|jgi:integrase
MKHSVKIALEKRKDKTGQIITENVPLFAEICFAGNRIYYFTGYRINKDKFSKEAQQAKKNSSGKEGNRIVQYNDINDRLKKIKAELELFFQKTNKATKQDIITLLDVACKKAIPESTEPEGFGFFNLFEKYLKVAEISKVRKRNINSTLNHWRRFESSRKLKITIDNVTIDLLRDFEKYLREESTRPKARNNDEQISSPKGVNTIHTIMVMTRAFFNFAKKEMKQNEIEIHYPFGPDGYEVPSEVYGNPIYITKEERNDLFNASVSSERLKRVRDIFVFQCLIGVRVGDLSKLTKLNIQDNILSYIPRKTKDGKPVTVNVPLSKNALDILSRYDFPDGRLLPFITDQRYNDYLKELFKEVGLTRIVTRINPTTGEPEQISLADIASSHMARRTFIGNLYGKVDTGIISSMSGHVEGSRSFTRYRVASPELQRQAIDLID